MSRDGFDSFSNIVAGVFKQHAEDPIEHMLVLTYEYDEQQLLNMLCKVSLEDDFDLRQSHLKWLSDLRPVVIHDARKTKESSRLPQFVELHPFKTRAFSCHHSKGYLLITQRAVRLVLGSFNLTKTGLFENREVLESFVWDSDRLKRLSLLKEFTDFLRNNYLARLSESSQSALQDIVDMLDLRIVDWEAAQSTGKPEVWLLSSGYGDHGIDHFRQLWRESYPDSEPENAIAVSPFFDETPQSGCLTKEIKNRFPALKSLSIVTDETVVEMLSKAHFGEIDSGELYCIRKELKDEEKDRIERVAKAANSWSKDLQVTRKLHAKVLMVYTGCKALVYMGSANFTRKAWLGDNNELGVVWPESDPQAFRSSLLKCLCADAENRYESLPGVRREKTRVEDPEGYKEDSDYPGFLELVSLEQSETPEYLRFRFECGKREHAQEYTLSDYQIDWGGIAIAVNGEYSQELARRDFQSRLARSRNLCFRPKKDPSREYFFPYQYSGSLIAERETFIHPTSWEWMAFYLNPDRGASPGEGEFVPGEPNFENDHDSDILFGVEREKNCVIAMQAYLNLFSRIERDFHERLSSLGKPEDEKYQAVVEQHIVRPLRTLLNLLVREAGASSGGSQTVVVKPDDIFKVGELLLFLKFLSDSLPDGRNGHLDSLMSQIGALLAGWANTESLQEKYIKFVLREAGN